MSAIYNIMKMLTYEILIRKFYRDYLNMGVIFVDNEYTKGIFPH